jgi:ADP-ribose pyrophosphatase YjhB (NUDIX family)
MNKLLELKVAVLVKTKDGLVLIKEKHKKSGDYRWNIVKGTFEPGKDTDLVSAAKREMGEEISCIPNIIGVHSIYTEDKSDSFVLQVNFVAELGGEEFSVPLKELQIMNDEDIVEVRELSMLELSNLKRDDVMTERIFQIIESWVKFQNINSLDIIKSMFR